MHPEWLYNGRHIYSPFFTSWETNVHRDAIVQNEKPVVQTGVNPGQPEPDVLFSSALGEIWRAMQEWSHGCCLQINHKTHCTHNHFIVYIIWAHLCHQELLFNQQLWMYFTYFFQNLPMEENNIYSHRDTESGETWVMPSLTLRPWLFPHMNKLIHEESQALY